MYQGIRHAKSYEKTRQRIELTDKNVYDIPHHTVFKETSTTTKLRAVFNASKATLSGKSLNDPLSRRNNNKIFKSYFSHTGVEYLWLECCCIGMSFKEYTRGLIGVLT